MRLFRRGDGDLNVHSFEKWDGLPVARGLQALKLIERLVEAPLERHLVAIPQAGDKHDQRYVRYEENKI